MSEAVSSWLCRRGATAKAGQAALHLPLSSEGMDQDESAMRRISSGRAAVTTRIRLGDSQRVRAIAQMSDGSFWQGDAATLVTLAACTEV